jgi:hypothetical protein
VILRFVELVTRACRSSWRSRAGEEFAPSTAIMSCPWKNRGLFAGGLGAPLKFRDVAVRRRPVDSFADVCAKSSSDDMRAGEFRPRRPFLLLHLRPFASIPLPAHVYALHAFEQHSRQH